MSLADAFAEYELNADQQGLVGALEAFLNHPTQQVFLLKGYAGTGKTFITKGLTEYFNSIGRNYILMAPTGKAARVIAKKTGSSAFTIHRTIYSFKDIREFREPDLDGSETFKYYSILRANESPDNTVYITDESSMLADIYQENEFFRFGSGFLLTDLMKFINFDHNDHNKKLIVIGDSAQLPPVGMNTSPALDASYLKQKFNVNCAEYELTHVVRQQAGSGVMANALMLRDSMAQGVFNQLDFKLDFPDVTALKHEQLVAHYLEACNHESMSNQAVILCGSNADVKHYNDRIREEFFPGKTEIQPRDKLIMIKNTEAEGHLITNGEFVYVTACSDEVVHRVVTLKAKNADNKTDQRVVELSFRNISIAFRDENDSVIKLNCVLLETVLNSSDSTLNSDQQKALYVDFCIRNPHLKRGSKEFKDALLSDPLFNALRAKYGYAITVHKAQGSEWSHVFVKCKTPQYSTLSHVYFRWFYTAITRTSSHLYVLDEPHILPGSGLKKASQKDFSWLNAANNQPLAQPATLQQQEVHEDVTMPAANAVTSLVEVSKHATDFGIPASEEFLVALFNEVNQLIAPLGAEVTGILHNQYQERYFIERQQEQACININYSGKNKVTRVQYAQLTEFNAEISSLLSSLVNKPLALIAEGAPTQLSENFMQQLYQRLEAMCDTAGITIAGVMERPFCLEFSFKKGSAFTCINIYYNGKKQFTRYQYAQGKSNSAELTQTIEALIEQEISG
ncbi:ATP-dependent DNA helicase [Alishewanella sp. HL-SH05]|uniref:ATP-dependent DNA helicase n=1 Tax=Alishewanella sp. HL-SH05 TaxID=3461145 RepID=UPI00404354B6